MEPTRKQKPAERTRSEQETSPPEEPSDAAQPVSTERPSASQEDGSTADSSGPAVPAPEAASLHKAATKRSTSQPPPVPKAVPSAPGSRAGHGEAGQKPPSSHAPRLKPVLASEALRDDLAPVDPLASAVRAWGALAGVGFVALAFVPPSVAGVPGSYAGHTSAHLGLGVATIAVSVLPLRYAWRAAVLLFIAVACGLLGIAGRGPSSALAAITGEWGLLHLLAGLGLPAALLFRARYRAFAGARVILVAALLLTLPYAGYSAYALATGPSIVVQIVSAAAILVVLLSLLGFMGAETTGGGNAMAFLQITAVTAQLLASMFAVVDLGRQPLWGLGAIGSVAAFSATITIGALGLFQLLAWRFGPQARSVDTSTRLPAERPRKHSVVDWLTRG